LRWRTVITITFALPKVIRFGAFAVFTKRAEDKREDKESRGRHWGGMEQQQIPGG